MSDTVDSDRASRLAASLATHGLDALLVTHPPNLRYLTGLQASAGAAVVSPDHVVLIVDSRYETAARTLAAGTPRLAVHRAEKSLDDAIASVLRQAGRTRVGIEAAHLTVAKYNKCASLLESAVRLLPTERIVERMRAVKDLTEQSVLREAGRRLGEVARRLPSLVQVGRSERQIAASIDATMREAGFEKPAFETIVASGPNAALPHARPTHRTIENGEGVLLDFGGSYDGYCVDLTRTLHVGPASAPFRRLFDAVSAAHGAAVSAVKPGVAAVDIDKAARQVLVDHGLGEAFGHGTGHGVGLEVHEEPRISPLSPQDEPVVAGMVFTIEPGAYLPGFGGVRIENVVLVVDGGCEVLTP